LYNEQGNLICPVCKTANEQDFRFCKNCGTPLYQQTQTQTSGQQYTPPPNFGGSYGYNSSQTYSYYNPTPYTDYSAIEPTLEEVDTRKVQAFVGNSKQDYFMRLFIAMKRLGRKLFMNWPVAIMGMLLPPVFAASWFIYRKMYRIGIAICLCCFLITCTTTLLTYNATTDALQEIVAETKNLSDEEFSDRIINAQVNDTSFSYSGLITYSFQMVILVGVIYLALNANRLYYNHVIKKIKSLDSRHGGGDVFFYTMQGGTSVPPAIFIPLGFNALCNLVTLIPYIEIALSGVPLDRLLTLMALY